MLGEYVILQADDLKCVSQEFQEKAPGLYSLKVSFFPSLLKGTRNVCVSAIRAETLSETKQDKLITFQCPFETVCFIKVLYW